MADATAVLNEIVGALESLAQQSMNLIGDDRSFAEIWGWNQPAISRSQLAERFRRPKDAITNLPDVARDVDDQQLLRLAAFPPRLTWLAQNVMPTIPQGNPQQAYIPIDSLLAALDDVLEPMTDILRPLPSKNLLPAAQIRRLQTVQQDIDRLLDDASSLQSKIKVIDAAHSAAEALPENLQSLRRAQKQTTDALSAAQTNQAGAETARSNAEGELKVIKDLKDAAEKLVQGTENAFSAATTKGLGEEFGNRAVSLSKSVWILGMVLAVTLVIGGVIAYFRIEHLNTLMNDKNFSLQVLWAHVILSVASIAAPVWFAWLLTKQIGQRFRLSEDYAFKASVAKAYAGYSQEAARIDPEFQKRLYGTALARIDEEPLRHVETDNHGSPFHELLSRRKAKRSLEDKSQAEDDAGPDDQ